MIDLDQETIDSFIMEFREYIEEVTRHVLLLESDPRDAESVHALFRHFHNIKGNSGFLELDKMSGLSHQAETLLDSIREETLQINSDIIETLLTTADTLTALVDEVEGQGSFDQSRLNDLMNRLSSYLPKEVPLKGEEAKTEKEGKGNATRHPETPVLFVDDEPTAHKVVKKYLDGWNVKYAFSGKDALETIHKEDIQVVIADISMPEMDGIELLRRIKKRHGAVQVIMATASEELADLTDALEAGANDFLLKPLQKENIEEALENTLAKINRWKKTMKSLYEKTRADGDH